MILPIGGSIGLVARQQQLPENGGTAPDANCRLVIPSSNDIGAPLEQNSVVVPLELIATRNISAGELLLLDLPPSGTGQEISLLMKELQLMGRVPSSVSHFYVAEHDASNDEL